LIDAMIWAAISSIRNEAYLHLALSGRLPDTHRDQWLADECRLVAGVAAGFDGERALFNGSFVQMGEDASVFDAFSVLQMKVMVTGFGASPARSWWDRLDPQWLYSGPWMWATIHHDGAVTAELEAHISARLRGERSDPVPDWSTIESRFRGYGAIAIPNLLECGITALEAEARHRMYQIAVLLLSDLPAQDLPTGIVDLATRLGSRDWLAPSGDRLHLTYERLAPDRFRLVVSPTSPVPNFDAPGRLAGRTRAFGTPPDKCPLVTHPHLEIQLPARLRPAP
jgi:hypothetical protein